MKRRQILNGFRCWRGIRWPSDGRRTASWVLNEQSAGGAQLGQFAGLGRVDSGATAACDSLSVSEGRSCEYGQLVDMLGQSNGQGLR